MDVRALGRLHRELKRRHPELLGLGIGWRRKRGRVQKAPAIKLIVEKKRSRRAKSVRLFPNHLEFPLSRGKRPLSVRIHTDVEEAGRWIHTSFPISVNQMPDVTATCYATWTDSQGNSCLGLVTVAHAFPSPGQSVQIPTSGPGTADGVVYARSDLITDGLDVALIQLLNNPTGLLPCLPATLNPGAASVSNTINLLGLSDTDAQYAPMENWFSSSPATGRALAYYYTRTIANTDGTSYNLKSVVEADGPQGTYDRGRSGSPWVAMPSESVALSVALQSQGNEGLDFRLGLGTHLATALSWLSQCPNMTINTFKWAWRVEDLAGL